MTTIQTFNPVPWSKIILTHSRVSPTPQPLQLTAVLSQKPLGLPTNTKFLLNDSKDGLTPEDLDVSNTRLFVKGLSPDLHDVPFLHAIFRSFGKIRMLALNTKRHNALIEYDDKESACEAKKECKCIVGTNGRTYNIKMFWGKHINREPPVKSPPPTLEQQIERVRLVDAIQLRSPRVDIPRTWLDTVLGISSSSLDARMASKANDCFEIPPGFSASSPSYGSYTPLEDEEYAVGNYPLKKFSLWFDDSEALISKPLFGSPTISFTAPPFQASPQKALTIMPYEQNIFDDIDYDAEYEIDVVPNSPYQSPKSKPNVNHSYELSPTYIQNDESVYGHPVIRQNSYTNQTEDQMMTAQRLNVEAIMSPHVQKHQSTINSNISNHDQQYINYWKNVPVSTTANDSKLDFSAIDASFYDQPQALESNYGYQSDRLSRGHQFTNAQPLRTNVSFASLEAAQMSTSNSFKDVLVSHQIPIKPGKEDSMEVLDF